MDTNKLYNNKLSQFGEDDFRSLNWGDKEGKSAKARYQQMFDEYNWTNKDVLEVGCGWGSFFDFKFICKDYYGIDINSKLIDIANKAGCTVDDLIPSLLILEKKELIDYNVKKPIL